MKWRWNSLFGRLLGSFAAVIVVILLVGTLALNFLFQVVVQRHMIDVMSENARGVALWAEANIHPDSQTALSEENMAWLRLMVDGRLWLVDSTGRVLMDTDISAAESFRDRQLEHSWVTQALSGQVVTKMEPDPWMHSALTVAYPIWQEGKVAGAVFLFVSHENLGEVHADLLLPLALLVVIATIIGLAAAFGLSHSVATPVEQMSRFAAALGEKRFADQLLPSGILELDGLASSLQGAARELEISFLALTEEKQRIQALIQEMAEGVVAIDEHHRILLINPAAERLLDLSDQMAGQAVEAAAMPGPLVRALLQATGRAASECDGVTFAHGGTQLHADVSPVVAEGERSFGAVALLQDVTAETQLSRLRESFVANVSHELRGPLAALSAGVEAMSDGLIGDSARPRYLKAMRSELDRLRRLVNDLLELSRLDAGELQIPLEEIDLRPLCKGLVEKWEPRAQAAGVQLEMHCPHLTVIANYDRVEEILTNFLDNALRATLPGGRVRVFGQAESAMVRVGVSDTGIGIAREHLPLLWDRFYKVDQARTRTQDAGTGLGLAIVRQLVERMGGRVTAESETGHGSTFSFTLVAASSTAHPEVKNDSKDHFPSGPGLE